MWTQRKIALDARPRGFHLVTGEILKKLPELEAIQIGIAHLFIQHTSASLSINENADPTVRGDFERFMNLAVPENADWCEHTLEGSDDMPAHIKSSLLGNSVTLPITGGRFNLGTWQGIYLGEHRNHGGPRSIVVTIQGE